MAKIDRQQNESIERMISRFRRIIMRQGTMKMARERMYFVRPETKRQQKLRAIYREQRRREVARENA